MKIEHASDRELGNLLRIADDRTELFVALDFGIRIIRLNCIGMENLLYNQPSDRSDQLTTEYGWQIFGGHRFWAAPESEKSYFPDRDPVSVKQEDGCIKVIQKPDPWTGFQKEIDIAFTSDGRIEVKHILINRSDERKKAAAWGITTLKGGGTAYVPFQRGEAGEYNPRRVLSIWGRGSLADPRIEYADDEIRIRHMPMESSLKIGVYNRSGSVSMENLGQKLEIGFEPLEISAYPDNGSNTELFVNRHIMELETLGRLTDMAPGESAIHTEYWRLNRIEQ